METSALNTNTQVPRARKEIKIISADSNVKKERNERKERKK